MVAFETNMEAPEWTPLLDVAWRAWGKAYAPYSNFRVGAAIYLENGAIIGGCNVENAAHPVALCAERTALCAAVAQEGLRPGQIVALAIVTEATELTPPCGTCRQALVEFGENFPILLANKHHRKLYNLAYLLPIAFTGSAMAKQNEIVK